MEGARKIADDFRLYSECLSEAMGKSIGELMGRRTYPLPYYRGMIATSLRELGYTCIEIGDVMGRNHSTILYGINRLREALGTKGFGDIAAIWRTYQAEVAKRKVVRTPLELMAEEYVGRRCNKACDICDISKEHCRYLHEERLFIAGAEKYKELLGKSIEELRSKTAECSLLCGKDDLKQTLAVLDGVLTWEKKENDV